MKMLINLLCYITVNTAVVSILKKDKKLMNQWSDLLEGGGNKVLEALGCWQLSTLPYYCCCHVQGCIILSQNIHSFKIQGVLNCFPPKFLPRIAQLAWSAHIILVYSLVKVTSINITQQRTVTYGQFVILTKIFQKTFKTNMTKAMRTLQKNVFFCLFFL